MESFFDLDGPILDVSARYHEVYRLSCKQLGLPYLDKHDYWKAKRCGLSNINLIQRYCPDVPPELLDQFAELWLGRIEQLDFLAMDQVIDGALDMLEVVCTTCHCYLVTLRRSSANLLHQLDYLSLRSYFLGVLSGQQASKGWQVKANLISKIVGDYPEGWIVGDSETDIKAGQYLGLVTCAVSNGMRNREFLMDLVPDFIIEGVSQLPVIMRNSKRQECR